MLLCGICADIHWRGIERRKNKHLVNGERARPRNYCSDRCESHNVHERRKALSTWHPYVMDHISDDWRSEANPNW